MCRFTLPPVLVALASVPPERYVTVDVRFWSTTGFEPNARMIALLHLESVSSGAEAAAGAGRPRAGGGAGVGCRSLSRHALAPCSIHTSTSPRRAAVQLPARCGASTSPFGFIVLTLLGFVAGVVNVVRSAGVASGKR